MSRLICKVPRNQDFFPVKKKLLNIFFLFLLISMTRIICIPFYIIDWYIIYSMRLHFYHIYIILKERANHIIFLDYLTGMKIVVRENLNFEYSKNFLCIRFFGIGLKIGTDLHKHII